MMNYSNGFSGYNNDIPDTIAYNQMKSIESKSDIKNYVKIKNARYGFAHYIYKDDSRIILSRPELSLRNRGYKIKLNVKSNGRNFSKYLKG